MPHFKCVACKTRLYSATGKNSVGDLCPECGSLLEPVGALAEVVGFRSIAPREGATSVATSSPHPRIANRIGDLIARREVARAQARLDAERRFDDGGSFTVGV
jgi:hypothetical protein